MKLPEMKKIVPLLNSVDTGAGVSMDSINMKGFHYCTLIITFGAMVGDAILTIASGASDAALTSDLEFHTAYGGAAIGSANSDVLTADAATSALTIAAATYANKMLVVEVDASAMDVANEENWLTCAISAAGTSAIVHAVAILEPRYTGNRSLTATA
jgi:hypothetical protein